MCQLDQPPGPMHVPLTGGDPSVSHDVMSAEDVSGSSSDSARTNGKTPVVDATRAISLIVSGDSLRL
jgi:hypothetical protein